MEQPRITYKYWWQRFSPKQRRIVKALDMFFGWEWERRGGRERFVEELREKIQKML